MTKPYTQFTEQNPAQSLAHYKATKKIQDVLLACFDQHGRWFYHPYLDDDDCYDLPQRTISPNLLVNTFPNGQTSLLCSYLTQTESRDVIDFHHVVGQIFLMNALRFSAPNLQTVGGGLTTESATIFRAQKLQTANGDLNAKSATFFDAPMLGAMASSLMLKESTMRTAVLAGCRPQSLKPLPGHSCCSTNYS